MLIHLGDGEFVQLQRCVMILNLETVDPDTRERARQALGATFGPDLRTALIVDRLPRSSTSGKTGSWLGSTLSSIALAGRGVCSPLDKACYRRPPRQKRSEKRSRAKETSIHG